MPFFQVCDQMHVNAKFTAMVENEPLTVWTPAVALWTMGGSMSQAKLSDGVLTTGDLTRLLLNRSAAVKAASTLVKHGLWHGHGHGCDDCPPVPDGSYVFHQWGQMGYASGGAVKVARARRKETQNPEIIEAVWARDTDATGQAHCRYCNVKVSRHDRKSERRPTLDHVIPGVARGVTNLVVSCLKCNREKGQRTPEQAGMKLLPPPSISRDTTAIAAATPSVCGPTSVDNSDDPSEPQTADQGEHPDEGSGSNPGSNRSRFDSDLIHALPRGGARGPGARAREGGAGQGKDRGTSRVRSGSGWVGPAGPAPSVGAPDTFGSPWHGVSRPPPGPPPDEATCPEHGLPAPCRRCARESYAEEAQTT